MGSYLLLLLIFPFRSHEKMNWISPFSFPYFFFSLFFIEFKDVCSLPNHFNYKFHWWQTVEVNYFNIDHFFLPNSLLPNKPLIILWTNFIVELNYFLDELFLFSQIPSFQTDPLIISFTYFIDTKQWNSTIFKCIIVFLPHSLTPNKTQQALSIYSNIYYFSLSFSS